MVHSSLQVFSWKSEQESTSSLGIHIDVDLHQPHASFGSPIHCVQLVYSEHIGGSGHWFGYQFVISQSPFGFPSVPSRHVSW